MKQANLIKRMKLQGFDLKFKMNGNVTFFCAGVAFPQDPPFEDNTKFFAKHQDFIKSLTKAEWQQATS